jgi:hypothetical protein
LCVRDLTEVRKLPVHSRKLTWVRRTSLLSEATGLDRLMVGVCVYKASVSTGWAQCERAMCARAMLGDCTRAGWRGT